MLYFIDFHNHLNVHTLTSNHDYDMTNIVKFNRLVNIICKFMSN